MLVAEQRRSNQRQIDRRAKPARRSTRLRYPKTAAQRLHQSRSAHKNQNPQNGQLMARFDWGLGAVCFGASPVAAVFGSAPGSATPPEHRIHCKPSSQAAPIKQDISTLLGIGHFYFALTTTRLVLSRQSRNVLFGQSRNVLLSHEKACHSLPQHRLASRPAVKAPLRRKSRRP
jgi:hypothetical protein